MYVAEWNYIHSSGTHTAQLWANWKQVSVSAWRHLLVLCLDGLECRLGVPVRSNGVIIHMTSRTLRNAATSWITYHLTFPAGSRGGALVGGLGDKVPQLKVDTSKFYAFFGSNSHTVYEIETLIIVNENYEAQLQSANRAPIRTTFIQHMKKMSKTAGDP